MKFDEIVEQDLKNPDSLTMDQRSVLQGNIEQWRNVLAKKVRAIDAKLSESRLKALRDPSGDIRLVHKKQSASDKLEKNVIINRLHHVNAALKEYNIEKHNEEDNRISQKLDQILAELAELRSLIAKADA